MSGEETFEFAAAIAGVSIGLLGSLLLAVLAVLGTWRLFRRASEASEAASRAALTVEELARRLALAPQAPAGDEFAALRDQAQALMERQDQLNEMTRTMLDTAATGGGPSPAVLEDLESAVSRLDTTVGQMATSLANLIQLLERRQGQP